MLSRANTDLCVIEGKGGCNHANTDLCAIEGKGGQVVWVLLVPREAQQGQLFRVLVQDGGVFQIPGSKEERHVVNGNWSKMMS